MHRKVGNKKVFFRPKLPLILKTSDSKAPMGISICDLYKKMIYVLHILAVFLGWVSVLVSTYLFC